MRTRAARAIRGAAAAGWLVRTLAGPFVLAIRLCAILALAEAFTLGEFITRHFARRRLAIALDRDAPALAIGERIRARILPGGCGRESVSARAAKLAPQFLSRLLVVVRAPGVLGAFAAAFLLRPFDVWIFRLAFSTTA